jgi:hypothetical protein
VKVTLNFVKKSLEKKIDAQNITMPRRSFTNRQKLDILAAVKERQANGDSIRKVAASLRLDARLISDWSRSTTHLLGSRECHLLTWIGISEKTKYCYFNVEGAIGI